MLTIVSQVSVMFWGGQRPNPMHNIWEMALKRDQEYCSPTVAFWKGTLTTNVKCRASVTLARVWCTILTVQYIDHHIRYNHTNNVVWTQPGWVTKEVSCNMWDTGMHALTSRRLMAIHELCGISCKTGIRNWMQPFQWASRSISIISFEILSTPPATSNSYAHTKITRTHSTHPSSIGGKLQAPSLIPRLINH